MAGVQQPHVEAGGDRSSSSSSSLAASAPAPARPTTTLKLRSSSGGGGGGGIRRATTQERLDGILERGLQRAESMSPGRSPPAFRTATNNSASVAAAAVFQPHQEPDETTGIVMRGPNHSAPSAMNYQSIAPADDGTSSSRARKTAGSRRRRSEDAANGNGNGQHQENNGGDGYGDGSKEAEAWWRAQLAKFGSIELENKGSVARDHLALERTFLAWLRTSLSFASIGVAITQLFRLNTSLSEAEDASSSPQQHTLRHLGKPLGAVFLGISILILFLGYHRYFQAQQWIIKGKFPASRGTVILVSLVALCLMVISLVVVLLVQPAAKS